MKAIMRTIIKRLWLRRLGWLVAIWAGSVLVLAAVAWPIRALLKG